MSANVTIDLKALDNTIRKLQQFRKLAADPDLAPFIPTVMADVRSTSTRNKKSQAELKGVKYDVLANVPNAGQSETTENSPPLTSREITVKMEAAKYKFKSRDHGLTVRDSLRALYKEGLVEKAGVREEDGAVLWRRR